MLLHVSFREGLTGSIPMLRRSSIMAALSNYVEVEEVEDIEVRLHNSALANHAAPLWGPSLFIPMLASGSRVEQVNITTDEDLGTIYSVAVPVKRVKPTARIGFEDKMEVGCPDGMAVSERMQLVHAVGIDVTRATS